jgi:hypothetical protein
MSKLDDARLEQKIGAAMRRRCPGPAPIGLRERVARVPEGPAARGPALHALSRAVVPVLGLAATIAVLLLVIPLLLVSGTGPGPGASVAPLSTFDPTLEGPGMVTGWISTEFVIGMLLIAGGALVVIGWRIGGRRGFALVALIAVAVIGVAQTLTASVGPGSLTSSRGLGVILVSPPAGSTAKDVAYITAAPGEPFWVVVSLRNDGTLPIRFFGLRDPLEPDTSQPPGTTRLIAPRVTGAWRDTAEHGGSNGQESAVPLAPIDLGPGDEVVLYVMGRADACAYGPTYDPAIGSTVGYRGLPEIDLVYTVFGMPRSVPLEWPYDLLEPTPDAPCPPQP